METIYFIRNGRITKKVYSVYGKSILIEQKHINYFMFLFLLVLPIPSTEYLFPFVKKLFKKLVPERIRI